MENVYSNKKICFTIYVLVNIFAFTVVYLSIIFHGNIYVFLDIGADTYCSYWPSLSYVKNWLSDPSAWDMSLGLGSSTITQLCYFLIDPFNIPILFFQSENIPVGIFISLFCKYCALSVFSYLFISKAQISRNYMIKVMSAFTLVLSGWFVGWGQHYNYASIYVFFVLMLYFFECWMLDGSWMGFVFSMAYICMMSPYFAYQFFIFLVFYYLFRYLINTESIVFKNFVIKTVKTGCLCLVSILLSSIMFLPEVEEILNSPRVGSSPNIGIHFSGLIDYLTIVMRSFSSNSMGINDFSGCINYYEAPFLYFGLLPILLCPVLFVRKKKIGYYILLSVLILSIVFSQNTSLLFNMFSTVSYRWTVVLAPVSAIIFGKTLDYIIEDNIGRRIASVMGLVIIVSSVLFLAASFASNDERIDKISLISTLAVILFVSVYVFVISNAKKWNLIALFAVLVIEMVWNAYVSVNWRSLISKDMVSGFAYFDSSDEIADYLRSCDDDFYRIYKKYAYIDLNDSMIQTYNGERFYSSTLSDSYWNLMQLFDLRTRNSNYFKGFDDKQVLRNLNCGKYMITNEQRDYFGYELIATYSDKYIYENLCSMPFGVLYTNVISTSDFMALPQYKQQDVLYEAAIVEDSDICFFNDFVKKIDTELSEIESVSYQMEISDAGITITLDETNSKPLLLEVKFADNNLYNYVGEIYTSGQNEEYSPYDYIEMNIEAGGLKYYVINTLNIEKILVNTSPSNITSVALYEKDMSSIDQNILTAKEKTFQDVSVEDVRVFGTIYCPRSSLLFVPIMYGENWHAYVDGVEQSIIRVNGAFCGIVLGEGEHTVELKYIDKIWIVGCLISCLMFLGILCTQIIKKGIRHRNEK